MPERTSLVELTSNPQGQLNEIYGHLGNNTLGIARGTSSKLFGRSGKANHPEGSRHYPVQWGSRLEKAETALQDSQTRHQDILPWQITPMWKGTPPFSTSLLRWYLGSAPRVADQTAGASRGSAVTGQCAFQAFGTSWQTDVDFAMPLWKNEKAERNAVSQPMPSLRGFGGENELYQGGGWRPFLVHYGK